ncbi:hypothetical protein [Pseudaquabacterium pictum]|uniref:Uncharacterized protein n=1 Tax=Pseudaquabacterium pictum TaxID=2315236 RepID=A0A480AM63_9BURK|nr:hypothetical protein [Rubrivivax pictus]GCL62591.1 hypothetical protein AQPW35_16720 [Rubrivivax pictus]
MSESSNRSFTLKREIDLGQILTVISIVGSLVAFIVAWNKDQYLKDREYADRVRKSASIVTAKVERWGELSQRYFEDIQPTLVDVSEKVAETNSTQPANRMLFKGLMDAKAKASQRIVDEQLQIAYMELYGYVPTFQGIFDTTIDSIRSAERAAQENLRSRLQDVLRDEKVLSMKESPLIGKALRDIVEDERKKLSATLVNVSAPLRAKILQIIRLSDAELRDANEKKLSEIFAPATATKTVPFAK